jgi:3-hydroxyacyl-[acyl-carrier-protein] dehydratase
MRFRQLDRITKLQPGKRIEATKSLSSEEGYLKDHFPRFPVMPGVLMLEAMFQASNWLVRATDEFTKSVVVLKEVKNVKYRGLVHPGQTLTVTADIAKQDGERTTLVAKGTVNGERAVSGRFVLERFDLADRIPSRAATDAYLRGRMRREFEEVRSSTDDGEPHARLSTRWMWIDRILQFIRGERSVAVKNVSMTEEAIDEYMPGYPVMPCSLIIEGIALTGGILVNDQHGFEKRIVLARVNKAVFHRLATPGDTLEYRVNIERLRSEGAFVRGSSHIANELQAEVELFLAHLGDRVAESNLFNPADTLTMLRLFGLYDVGQNPDGTPIDIAQGLLEAEQRALAREA